MTNAESEVLYSRAVTYSYGTVLPFGIATQPSDAHVGLDADATFKVVANSALSYQWQYSKDGGETWGNLKNGTYWRGNKTDTLTFVAASRYDQYLFRCKVTGATESIVSAGAQLIIDTVISKQPVDFDAAVGDTVTFSTTVNASEAALQWQYSKDEGATWGNLTNGSFWKGNKSDTLTFTAAQKYAGYKFRLRVIIGSNTIYSDVVTLNMDAAPSLPVITVQPQDQTVESGAKATFSVTATGATAYQWQYSSDGKTWKNLTNASFWVGNTTNTLTFTATEKYTVYQYRCQVTNAAGSVNSNAASLAIKAEPAGPFIFDYDAASGYYLKAYTGSDAKVVIPGTDEAGHAITLIGEGAFKGNTTMTSVTIPDSVTEIGASAFENCTKLQTVTFSSSLEVIGKAAFKNCTALTTGN